MTEPAIPKCVTLSGSFEVPAPLDPVPNVVVKLEELLRKARDGQLRGFAYAAINAQGYCDASWATTPDRDGLGMKLLGAITQLQFKYARNEID